MEIKITGTPRDRSQQPGRFEFPTGSGRWYETVPPGSVPGGTLLDIAAFEEAEGPARLRLIGGILDTLLTADSSKLFEEALHSPDQAINITLPEAVEIVRDLISALGRPTGATPGSESSGVAGGSTSTATAPSPA